MTGLLDGVACPMITPLENGDVDTESLETHVDWLIDSGIDTLVPCGTTGEFASLTNEERRTVVDATVAAADGRVPVVAGAADTTVTGTAERIDGVVGAGADAALVPPPYYHGSDDAGLGRFYDDVLATSSGPVVLYNFPSLTGQSIPAELVGDLAARERVVGVKDSSGDFSYALSVDDATPDDFEIAVGRDRYLGTAVREGLAGGVVGLTNVVPEAMVAIHDSATSQPPAETAEIRRRHVEPILSAVEAHGYVPVLKRILAERGTIASPEIRPPLTTAPAEIVGDIGTPTGVD